MIRRLLCAKTYKRLLTLSTAESVCTAAIFLIDTQCRSSRSSMCGTTNDPIGTLRQIYDHLSLGDITPALDSFPEYLAPRKSYVTNRHELSRYWQDQIRSEWSEYFETFGYADEAE